MFLVVVGLSFDSVQVNVAVCVRSVLLVFVGVWSLPDVVVVGSWVVVVVAVVGVVVVVVVVVVADEVVVRVGVVFAVGV